MPTYFNVPLRSLIKKILAENLDYVIPGGGKSEENPVEGG